MFNIKNHCEVGDRPQRVAAIGVDGAVADPASATRRRRTDDVKIN